MPRLLLSAALLLAVQFAPGDAFANANEVQTYFAKAPKKPAPKPKRGSWSTTQDNLECPPPARPACGN